MLAKRKGATFETAKLLAAAPKRKIDWVFQLYTSLFNAPYCTLTIYKNIYIYYINSKQVYCPSMI